MSIAYVQSRSVDSGTGTSANLAYTSNVAAGSLLVVAIRLGAGGTVSSVTDDKGNSYALAASITVTSSCELFVYYAMNSASGATTITIATSSTTRRWAIHEYSGVATASALDQTHTNQGTSTTPDSGNVTTTQADELLFGTASEDTGSATWTAGTSNTLRETPSNKLATEERIVSSTGTYSSGFSLNGSEIWGAIIATFKGGGGAAPASLVFNPIPLQHLLVR